MLGVVFWGQESVQHSETAEFAGASGVAIVCPLRVNPMLLDAFLSSKHPRASKKPDLVLDIANTKFHGISDLVKWAGI